MVKKLLVVFLVVLAVSVPVTTAFAGIDEPRPLASRH